MFKKGIILLIFLIGLSIFSYPIISNYFMTKEHYEMIGHYNETIRQMEIEQLKKEKEKANQHNEQLMGLELNYVDPFSKQESQRSSNDKSYYDVLQISPAIGHIRIPKINVELPIYHGTEDKVLSRGVGHLENSSFPTGKTGTHSVLTAHRGLPSAKLFRNLNQLTIGDHFFVQVLDETFAYEVYDVRIVEPDETDWLQFYKDKSIVTLLTCDPYMINTHRLLVMGNIVEYDEELELEEFDREEKGMNWFFVAILLIVVIFVIWLYRKKGGLSNEKE